MTRALTPMQARVLAVITAAIAQTGRPPTTREIATAVGVRSLNAVAGHMWALERKGYVVRDRNVARGSTIEIHMGDRTVRVAAAPGDTDAVVAANVRSATERMLHGAPTPREQVKARARAALLTHGGWGEWRDNQPARGGASIAREQNAGLRDAYVVRLNGAPQFTTYDVEEALDIFADMVTGERARSERLREETPCILRAADDRGAAFVGTAGELRALYDVIDRVVCGTVADDEAVIGGTRFYVLRWQSPPVMPSIKVTMRGVQIAGTLRALSSLRDTILEAENGGWASREWGHEYGVHVTREDVDDGKTARESAKPPARNPDPAPGQASASDGGRWIVHHPDAAVRDRAEEVLNALAGRFGAERREPARPTLAPVGVKRKPAAFAAGQVWTSPWAGVQRATLTRPDPDDPDIYWSFEENPVDGLPIAALTDDRWFCLGTKAELEDVAKRLGLTATVAPIGRTFTTPGGIPATAPEPTEEQRIAAAILERRCLDTGTPRREGEDDDALTTRLDAAEVDRLLACAIAKGRPWLVGVAYAREGHTVILPDARALVAALDALVSERDVDAAVETFRRARMATGPTWLRPALDRAARELTGSPAVVVAVAPRVQRTRWADPCAWAEAVNFWERETR